MPRLTQATYLNFHDHLRQLWRHDSGIFSLLSAPEQWDIHIFYATQWSFSDGELAEYRQKITAQDPSLPQRAGKALNKLLRALDTRDDRRAAEAAHRVAQSQGGKRKTRNVDRVIRITGLVHPQPDTEKLARALLEHVREMEHKTRVSERTARLRLGPSDPTGDQQTPPAKEEPPRAA